MFIVNQDGNAFDLLILKELISHMAGIDSVEDMTASQLEALAGGPSLRAVRWSVVGDWLADYVAEIRGWS